MLSNDFQPFFLNFRFLFVTNLTQTGLSLKIEFLWSNFENSTYVRRKIKAKVYVNQEKSLSHMQALQLLNNEFHNAY